MWFNYWARPGRVGVTLTRIDVSPDFWSPVGYMPEVGYRKFWGRISYYDQFDKGELYGWDWSISGDYATKYGGSLFYYYLNADAGISFRNNTGIGIWHCHGRRLEDRNDIWSVNCSWRHTDLYRRGRIGYSWGKQGGADYRFISLSQGLKLSDRLSMQISGELLDMDYPAGSGKDDVRREQAYASAVYDITPEKGLGLGFRFREGHSNLFCTYRQEVRRGLDIFVLWGDPNSLSTENRLSFKLLRVL